MLRILDDGEVHETVAFTGLGLRLQGRDHPGGLRSGLHLVGKTVEKGEHLVRVAIHDLGDGHQAHETVGIGFRRLLLISVELLDDILEIRFGSVLVFTELGDLGAVVGHEFLHPVIVGRIMGLGSLFV